MFCKFKKMPKAATGSLALGILLFNLSENAAVAGKEDFYPTQEWLRNQSLAIGDLVYKEGKVFSSFKPGWDSMFAIAKLCDEHKAAVDGRQQFVSGTSIETKQAQPLVDLAQVAFNKAMESSKPFESMIKPQVNEVLTYPELSSEESLSVMDSELEIANQLIAASVTEFSLAQDQKNKDNYNVTVELDPEFVAKLWKQGLGKRLEASYENIKQPARKPHFSIAINKNEPFDLDTAKRVISELKDRKVEIKFSSFYTAVVEDFIPYRRMVGLSATIQLFDDVRKLLGLPKSPYPYHVTVATVMRKADGDAASKKTLKAYLNPEGVNQGRLYRLLFEDGTAGSGLASVPSVQDSQTATTKSTEEHKKAK